ncbi:hypothetical protein GCM10009733_007550 [Nonomuraea maheshkhaliensis]|uniref:Uncharacterized protein n=1 Tax=Nonomuraea maheshkhaliensis TaxID=419590 RepID=A0ABN2EPN8_9ACTN
MLHDAVSRPEQGSLCDERGLVRDQHIAEAEPTTAKEPASPRTTSAAQPSRQRARLAPSARASITLGYHVTTSAIILGKSPRAPALVGRTYHQSRAEIDDFLQPPDRWD